MIRYLLLITLLVSFGCKKQTSTLSGTKGFENDQVQKLWKQHVENETTGKQIQPDCMPRHYPVAEGVKRKGMVFYLHGFTACPQQFFDISERLVKEGYEVFLPLLPGQGRKPFPDDKDNLSDLPSSRGPKNKETGVSQRLVDFVKEMNAIAKAGTGEKVMIGLSGGGGLATGAVVTGPDIWNRAIFFAPYYKVSGVAAAISAVIDRFYPQFVNDWGDNCRRNRLREDGRNGYCSVTAGAVRTMVDYGVYVSKHIDKINIPIQYAGVEHDATADNRTIYKAFTETKNAKMCLYNKGVPHSIINPRQEILPTSDPKRSPDLPQGPPYAWVSKMQDDTVNFIVNGTWFPAKGESELEKKYKVIVPMCNQ